MLNVTAQSSAEGAKSYFAKSDYYSEGQELTGRWGGKGAVLLGLFGQVDKPAFDKLCDNINPANDQQLTAITRDNRRVGYDFTWSAPKSVSVVHALTGDDRIMEAFRASINDTMGEMEADMQTRVRKHGKDEDRTTGNLTWAEFVHLTSRPVNGVPCPQLHAHLFAWNATFDVAERKWKAGQFGKLKGESYYWQAVQQARFADRLQQLGYAIRRTKDAFEIEGVPPSVAQKFSLRTKQIEETAERLGITDPKVKAKLGATTREAKDNSIPYPDLVTLWDKQLSESERQSLRGTRGAPIVRPAKDATHARFAMDHSFERASVVDEKRLLTLALRHGIGEVTPEAVRAEISKLPIMRRQDGNRTVVTTQEVLNEERRILTFAVSGKNSCRPLVQDSGKLRFELLQTRLSGEQQAAVGHLLTSPDRVMILRGVAGSGKTTLTSEAVSHLATDAGKSVVMLAPSARASRGVLRDEGFKDADTLARFLIDPKMQAGAQNGVIWLDEAGLVGTKTMAALFDVADKLSARVILAGDVRQTASVERGAALRVLENVAGLKVAEVREIRRQTNEDYKSAVKFLADGYTLDGLGKLDAMGWVKQMPVWDKYKPVAADYVEKLSRAENKEKDVLIVCPTHAEGERITEAVRHELHAKGVLGAEERTFKRLVPLQWTEAERGDRERYSGEEILQLHRNSGEFKAGQRLTGEAFLRAKRAPKAAHFAAYGIGTISLSPGDMVRVTGSGKAREGATTHKLENGSVYTVRRFNRAGDVELTNGWTVDRNFGHLAHAYVATAQASQGPSCEHVILCQSAASTPASNCANFYVAASRGRKSATIYCDDRRELKEAVERSNPRMSATELVARPQASIWRRMRDRATRFRLASLMSDRIAAHEASRAQPEYAYAR